METPDYEQIGAFIYGVRRLDFALGELTRWISGGALDSQADSIEDKFAKRHAALEAFFTADRRLNGVKDDLLQVLATVRDMEAGCNALLTGSQTGDLGEYIEKAKVAHVTLARVIERSGFRGVPPNFLHLD